MSQQHIQPTQTQGRSQPPQGQFQETYPQSQQPRQEYQQSQYQQQPQQTGMQPTSAGQQYGQSMGGRQLSGQQMGGQQMGGQQAQQQRTFEDHLTPELRLALEDVSDVNHIAEWCAKECTRAGPQLADCARICEDVADVAAINEKLIARDSMFGQQLCETFVQVAQQALPEIQQHQQAHPHVIETVAAIDRAIGSCMTALQTVGGGRQMTGQGQPQSMGRGQPQSMGRGQSQSMGRGQPQSMGQQF